MQYRSLTEKELRTIQSGDPVNVRLLNGKVIRRLFNSFVPGGITGDDFVRYRDGADLKAVDPERLVTPVAED